MDTPRPTTALVVGAGPGIGASLARALAAEGHRIGLVARDAGRLERLAADLSGQGADVAVRTADAGRAEEVAEAVRALGADGPVEVLAYNAAYRAGRLTDCGLDELRHAHEVNVLSALAAVRAARDDLVRTRGSVLLTGGGLALRPSAEEGVLSLGKAGLRAAAHILAADLGERGVRVRTLTVAGPVAPGTAFDPDLIARAFLALRDGDEVERVWTGTDAGGG
ncbi:SDR family NAD(P)-dependent oxidoreductase [Streptacidiphilus sp. ASG 303]|uniref:SDR family NAD(P)-dependent oxidoreductase n=1 Tax=Streptacidiphilus sp. ASG 303 TaxID=2896847 RepID=UPI001E3C8044|nr:SDR family NAD(P)-dependent oxidoreductase [Streptacidiphilus sp. ASG 303]MCD0483632.1 SDR family NAD(P)-dependent oxidoreductase [Streptacidiphilus sp. ASG 303]